MNFNAKPSCKIDPNSDLVLRDHKVLPEVRNQPLCQEFLFSHSTSEIAKGEPSVIPIGYPMSYDTTLQLEKFSEFWICVF